MEESSSNSDSMEESSDGDSRRLSPLPFMSEEEGAPIYEDDISESPLKRMKPSKEDRLSKLPDCLITHILSLMPAIYAVRTQVLSKRWRHAWASSPSLLFLDMWDLDDCAKFISTALMLHKGPFINKLYLSRIEPRDGLDPPINLWVQAAVIKQVEELVLEIDRDVESYLLPPSLFLCDTLRELSLTAGVIDMGSSVCWKSLKKLTLRNIVNLNNDMIQKIIDGSPGLECLMLLRCEGFSQITASSSSSNLRNLVIDGDFREDSDADGCLNISAPSITSLEISGYMGNTHCRLKDVSSLVRVALRYRMSLIFGYHEGSNLDVSQTKLQNCQCTLFDLLQMTRHVENLSMGTWCTQVLSVCELRRMPTLLFKCKSLEVELLLERSLPGLARLLQSSPLLERLAIEMGSYNQFIYFQLYQVHNLKEFSDFDGKNYWKSRKKGFKSSLQHLQVVQFTGLEAKTTFMVELAEFVLEHAKILEKLVLKPGESVYRLCRRSDLRSSSLFSVIQKLLSYPRSSHHARVLLL